MSNYNNEDWFNDSVKWYVSYENSGNTIDILSSELPLFTDIYTVFDGREYNTFEELQSLSKLPAQAYSVERPFVDTLILTCRYTPGTPAVKSLALVTVIDDSGYLIAKITRGAGLVTITNGVDRVFKFKLPHKIVGDVKVYPNISLRNKRYMSSPVGEEFVTTGEHHHNVDWGGEDARDSVPVLPQPSGRYVASADYNIQNGFEGANSFVYNESGILNSKVASITGKKVSSGSILPDLTANPTSRIIDTVTNILANIMEEYLMATNSIQILGHAIPTDGTSLDNQYVLYVDRVDASNERHLKAITSGDFRNWLVHKFHFASNAASTTCSTDSCVNIISAMKSITVSLNKNSEIAFVTNTNSGVSTTITISYGSSSISLYPRETAVIAKGSDGTYSAFKYGSTELLKEVLDGTRGFSKVAFASTAGDTTLLDDNLTVSSGKVNSVIKGTLGVTGATTLSGGVSGNLSTTGSITAGTGLTVTSGGISASGQNIAVGSISGITSFSTDTLTVGSITISGGNISGVTRVTVSDGFYIS